MPQPEGTIRERLKLRMVHVVVAEANPGHMSDAEQRHNDRDDHFQNRGS
jgi:hypothetical protein